MQAQIPVSRVDVGMEAGFHAGIGQNADWNNLLKTHLRVFAFRPGASA